MLFKSKIMLLCEFENSHGSKQRFWTVSRTGLSDHIYGWAYILFWNFSKIIVFSGHIYCEKVGVFWRKTMFCRSCQGSEDDKNTFSVCWKHWDRGKCKTVFFGAPQAEILHFLWGFLLDSLLFGTKLGIYIVLENFKNNRTLLGIYIDIYGHWALYLFSSDPIQIWTQMSLLDHLFCSFCSYICVFEVAKWTIRTEFTNERTNTHTWFCLGSLHNMPFGQ